MESLHEGTNLRAKTDDLLIEKKGRRCVVQLIDEMEVEEVEDRVPKVRKMRSPQRGDEVLAPLLPPHVIASELLGEDRELGKGNARAELDPLDRVSKQGEREPIDPVRVEVHHHPFEEQSIFPDSEADGAHSLEEVEERGVGPLLVPSEDGIHRWIDAAALDRPHPEAQPIPDLRVKGVLHPLLLKQGRALLARWLGGASLGHARPALAPSARSPLHHAVRHSDSLAAA